jgi:hypothetical protein
MEYGPEEYDDEDDSAWYEEPEWDQDEDEDEELNEHGGQEGYEPWGSQDLKPGQKAIQGKPVKDTKKFTKGLAKDLGKQFSQEPKVKEGWESGPEERAPRERDPDYDYDQARQEKLDIEAEKEQAKRPQQKVYTLTGRGPNYEPNYKFPGEYDSQEAAVAARAKLMADPNTPNPRDIGISTHTRYLDEGRETPLRDLEDYDAKKKALQDIQSNPHTANDPELSIEVMRRLAGLERQRKELK